MVTGPFVLLFVVATQLIPALGWTIAAADDKCITQEIFIKPQGLRQEVFPPPSAVGLTPAELDRIAAHPISKFATKYRNETVIFRSPYFGEMDAYKKGEWIQSQFVKRTLEELFPKARFVTESGKIPKGARVFDINVEDPLEQFMPEKELRAYLKSGQILPMHLIKPLGSRQQISMSKAEIREKLGISPKQKVLSLYIRAPDTLYDYSSRAHMPHNEYKKLLPAIWESFKYDIVVLSYGNIVKSASGVKYDFLFWARPELERIQDLDEILRAGAEDVRLKAQNKTILYNDTYGKMPYLHKAADLAVVVGPVNFYEPITNGTKTVLLKKVDSVSRVSDYSNYSVGALNEMADLAERAGGLKSANTYSEISEAIKEVKAPNKQSLEQLSEATLSNYLDALHLHLKRVEKSR